MRLPAWEEIEHTADVALRVRGASLAELFANAARGMLSLALGGDQPPLTGPRQVDIVLNAPDPETLLVDWLSEIVYLMEDEAFVPASVEVYSLEGDALRARLVGGAGATLQRHIKAVTYHDLSIQQTEGGYQATLVFDV